jgi:hypothetical protein
MVILTSIYENERLMHWQLEEPIRGKAKKQREGLNWLGRVYRWECGMELK